MKKKFSFILAAFFVILGVFSGSASAQTTDMAWSNESVQLYYDGHIKFVPSYIIPSGAGYSLVAGKTVNRGYINYTRDGVSVIGGRKYTATVYSGYDTVSTSASCWDSLNPIASKTMFYYGWYFSNVYA